VYVSVFVCHKSSVKTVGQIEMILSWKYAAHCNVLQGNSDICKDNGSLDKSVFKNREMKKIQDKFLLFF